MLIETRGPDQHPGEWALHLQPQVSLVDGRVTGVEALGRCRDESGTVRGADWFVDQLKDGWSTPSYRAFVYAHAAHLAAGLHDRHGVEGAPRLWINLSPACLATSSWITRMLLPACDELGVEATALGFEVTEAYIDDDLDAAVEVATRLRDLGAEIALDDFGTGYSSLTHLRRLPADVVKIDKSFVDMVDGKLRDTAIIGGLTDLVHTLGMSVVAEGVETPWQALTLSQLGVDTAQGHWFGRPVEPEQLDLSAWCGREPTPAPEHETRRADVWTRQRQLGRTAVTTGRLDGGALAAAVEMSGDLVLTLDDAGTITFANAMAWRLLRRTPESIIGTNAFDYVHPGDRQTAVTAFVQELTSPDGADLTAVIDMRVSHVDGTWIDVETVGAALFDGSTPSGLLVNIRDARERRRAVAQARASEARLRAFVESSGEIITVLDTDGTILDCNQRISKVLGYGADEVVGRSFSEFIHPDDIHEALVQWDGALRATNEVPAVLRLRDAEGRYRSCEIVSSRGPSVEASGVIVTVRDVDVRVQLEQELRRVGALDRLALRVARRALALPSAAFLAQLRELLHEVSADVGAQLEIATVATAVDRAAISIPIGPDGSGGWLMATSLDAGPALRIDRTALHTIAHTIGQVLERHRAEEERGASERLYRMLAEGAADIVLLCSADGSITYASPSVERVLGVAVDDAIGSQLLDHVDPDHRAGAAAALEHLRRGETVEMELPVLQASGDVRWLAGRARPGFDGAELAEINISAYDITDRRQLQQELERLAYHDPLTGLGNRTLLNAAIDAMADGPDFALAIVDLDGFKSINDRFGHAAGDLVLVAAADRIRRELDESDVAVRFGGDEFVVLLEDTCAERLERFVNGVSGTPISARTEDRLLSCGASVGVAAGPADDVERMFRSADASLYRAKPQRRTSVLGGRVGEEPERVGQDIEDRAELLDTPLR
ncbi:MAG: PAS domain S-box protein [Acidimicrobiia bacterium]